MNGRQNIALAVDSKLEELKSRIQSLGKLDVASVDSKNITNLFQPLLNVTAISVANLDFDFPDDSTMSLTATAEIFNQSLTVTAVFTLGDDNFELTLNNNGASLSLTLEELAKAGLLPSAIKSNTWPPIAIDDISFVFDSSVSALHITSGAGTKWDFLGYTGLYLKSPELTIVRTYNDGLLSNTAFTTGTFTNDASTVDIPIKVQLPIGLGGWSASLAEPRTLDNGLGVIDALLQTNVTSLLPEQFTKRLSEIEISSFYVSFDPTTNKVSALQVIVNTTADWVIVKDDKLKLDQGINLTLNASLDAKKKLQYYGSISGTASVNYRSPETLVQATAVIPIPLTGKDWKITLGNSEQDIGLGRLIAIVPGTEAILPKGLLDQLDKIKLEFLKISFKFASGFSFTNIAFSMHSDEKWQLPMLQSAVYLDELKFALDVSFPYKPTTTGGNLSGNIQIAGGSVTIPVSIAKAKADENWLLNVTSDQIPLPSISDLADFMGNDVLVSASPSGLMGIGQFEINNLNLKWLLGSGSKLELLSFTVASIPETPAWNLVPDYFVLTDLGASLKIENVSVSQKDISGSIMATVTLVLNKEREKNLVLGMLATKPASDKPWNFSGSLKEDLDLNELLLGLKLPQDVVSILPNLTVTQFDLAIEPSSKSFSTSMTVKSTDNWPLLTIGSAHITLDALFFSIEHYADNTDLHAKGSFNIGAKTKSAMVAVEAIYKKKIWNFKGLFTNAEKITINDVLEKYIPSIKSATIPQVSIDNIAVDFEKGPVTKTFAAVEDYSTLDFSINGTLTIPVIQSMSIKAAVHLLYDSRKDETKQYDGTQLKGVLKFGGLSFSVIAEYTNDAFSKFTFQLVYKNITAVCEVETEGDIAKFDFQLKSTDPNKRLSLGDLISTLIGAATGEAPDIPSPWNFINKIPIDGFGFVFTYNKKDKSKTIGLTYKPNINLGFITIDEFSLIYSPDAGKDQGPVQFAVTKGTFLGIPIDSLAAEEKPAWDLRNPEDAPKVPGMGDSAFKLENLSLGNQVAIKDGKPPKSVIEAIENLEKAFDPEDAFVLGEQKEQLPTALYFDKNYGWLIGAQFTLVKYINIAIIFYDPVIYGLSINVKGGKFKGLEFQILYKKVTDNVGVFQIDLTLPDFVRKQQFGAVSVTLPSISLSIFTNGDFLIDMGFPHNGDFARSFGLEFSIFTGAGGFYFGKLSNDSAADFNLPKADGQFNPVIAFGIGIRAGVGRSVDKGILKAELSLTIQVILEGIIAYYESNTSSGSELQSSEGEHYFRIHAQAGLVGRIYGEINFVIISASVDITAKILAELLVEAYRKTELTFTASVSAAVKVRINLGLFKITINCSFSTSVSDSFTIGSDSKAPWDTQLQLRDRSAFFTALDSEALIVVPEMDWTSTMKYDKEAIRLLFLPQLSVQYKEGAPNDKQGVGVSLLYIDNASNSGDATDFTRLSRAMLAWTFNAYFSKNGVRKDEILDQPVTIVDLNAIYAYLSQEKFASSVEPFGKDELLKFFFAQSFTDVTIDTKSNSSLENLDTTDQSVAIFPMFPIFKMLISGQEDVDFMKYGKIDVEYLKEIKAYFEEMKVEFNKEQDPTALKVFEDAEPGTLAEFLFIDYFAMIAKTGIQDAINDFKEIALLVEEGDSLEEIVHRYADHGVIKEELAFNNRHQSLKVGAKVLIPTFTYRLRSGETVQHLIDRLPELPKKELLKGDVIPSRKGKNNWITIPSFTYRVPTDSDSTLWSITERFNIDFADLLTHNVDKRNLFAPGTKLLHAFTEGEGKTVRNILDYLQSGEKFSLSNIGGTISRFFLHGLRIPTAKGSTTRTGLFDATGQQFPVTGFTYASSVSLKLNAESTKPTWMKFAKNEEVKFEFSAEMIASINTLVNSSYVPTLSLETQLDVKRYKLQGKTFTLPMGIEWKNPNLSQLTEDLTDSYLWKFPPKLQQYLLDQPNLAFDLLLQTRKTSFSLAESVAVAPLFWSTSVQVKIRQIPSSVTPDEPLALVYEVQGCGEADAQLLQELIDADGATIKSLDILFDENKSQDNNGKEVSGLTSNSLDEFKTFLLQTNFSTASNPNTFFALTDESESETAVSNLIGMDAKTFVTYLWDCSIVRSGGYYLSYNNGTGGGLPNDLFDEDGLATITLLVAYDIAVDSGTSAYKLPVYVNSVVLNKKIEPRKDNLYLEVHLTEAQEEVFNPELQTIQATILPGTGLFTGVKTNPELLSITNLAESADAQLNELYNLVEYRINETDDVFKETKFALPVGPTVVNESGVNSISAAPRQAVAEDGWHYRGVLPIYPFVIPLPKKKKGSSFAETLQTDPYGANGKKATVYFNFLDVFGNTLTPDDATGAGSGLTQDITPGYMDPVIALDQWVNVSKHYAIAKDTKEPTLKIHLGFDTGRYENTKDKIALATRDLAFYQKVKWQLVQKDVEIHVTSSIGTLKPPAQTPLVVLTKYVSDIMVFLNGVITPPKARKVKKTDVVSLVPAKKSLPLETKLSFPIDQEKINQEIIFALQVVFEIERTGYIDPQFVDEPTIRFASSAIPADLYKDSTDIDNVVDEKLSALDIFAKNLEDAIPVMRVAVGQAKPTASPVQTVAEEKQLGDRDQVKGKEVWLIRYAGETGLVGIKLNVDSTPVYFSTKPLSTKLISRPSESHKKPVPLRAYTSGAYIGDVSPEEKAYAGIDIEVLARTFVRIMDEFLSADMSTKAWNMQYNTEGGILSPDPQTAPFQIIEQAKKDVASAIAKHQLINILEGESLDGLADAQDALEQQLLISLEKAYSINAVMQNKVTVTEGFAKPTANFYGQLEPVDRKDKNGEKIKNIPSNAYSFTPIKVPLLTPSVELGAEASTITGMFSVRQESSNKGGQQNIDLIAEFKADLNYNITNIEHNFGTSINGYVPSSWLTLAHPITCWGNEKSPLIKADIPIPLKVYPTAPSMVKQFGQAAYPKETAIDGKKALEQALQWDYNFSYDYISAQQDKIYLNIRFNVQSAGLVGAEVVELDLFEALTQFNSSYKAVLQDFEKGDNDSLVALQSFAWMVQQVGNAWSNWFGLETSLEQLARHELDFVIQEFSAEEAKYKNYFMVTVASDEKNPKETFLPIIEIDGFETKKYTPPGKTKDAAKSITYYFVNEPTESPLLYADRKKYSQRIVKLTDHNILVDENAWAGISIHRNETLTGKPTNKDFRYITPYIRFVEPCLPSLYKETIINIADFTPDVSKENKVKLKTLLVNFFTNLFADVTDPVVVMQTKFGYGYALQPDGGKNFIPLGPTLPILLTTPTSTSWETPPTSLDQIVQSIKNWVASHKTLDIEKRGELKVVLSLYSSLTPDVHNPILKLNGLYLNTNLIDFS